MWPVIAAMVAGAGAQLLGDHMQSEAAKEASEKELQARKEAAEYLKAQGAITDSEYNKVINDINSYYAQRGSLGKKADVNEYKSAIQSYKPEDFVADVGDFSDTYNKTKEDFVNPYYNKIINDTAQNIQHSAAGAGLGRGTGAALNIAKGTAEKSDELYRTAMQDFQQDRDFAYKEYADAIANNQRRLDALRDSTQYKIGLEGNLANDYFNTQDQAMSDRMKAEQDRLAAKQAYAQAIGGLY